MQALACWSPRGHKFEVQAIRRPSVGPPQALRWKCHRIVENNPQLCKKKNKAPPQWMSLNVRGCVPQTQSLIAWLWRTTSCQSHRGQMELLGSVCNPHGSLCGHKASVCQSPSSSGIGGARWTYGLQCLLLQQCTNTALFAKALDAHATQTWLRKALSRGILGVLPWTASNTAKRSPDAPMKTLINLSTWHQSYTYPTRDFREKFRSKTNHCNSFPKHTKTKECHLKLTRHNFGHTSQAPIRHLPFAWKSGEKLIWIIDGFSTWMD
jgi:hypothetical protein